MQPTARENGIERLYHYQPFNDDHLAEILTDQRVRCSGPASLNDPWDCRPWFNEADLESPRIRAELTAFLQSFVPAVNADAWVKAAVNELPEGNTELLSKFLARFSADFPTAIRERHGIYCLTPHPDSTLMWSHYAHHHRGICLEFGTESSVFGAAMAVRYHRTYPVWHPHRLLADESVDVLLSKSDDWKYEHEYRVVGVRSPFCPAGLSIEANEDRLRLPPGALKSVIIGCEADCDAINAVAKRTHPDLPLRRAVRDPGRYRLQIV